MIKNSGSSPRRRSAVSGTKRKKCRTVSLLTTGFLLLPVAWVPVSEAHVESTVLRQDCPSTSQLLLWSSYDFSVDAAALSLTPIDIFMRGGANESISSAIEDIDTDSTASTETPSVEENNTQIETISVKENNTHKNGKYSFSLFQNGDGSDTDPDGIPARYLKMQGNQRDLAAKALEATLQWRREYDIDNLLSKPHTKFDLCKAVFPHYFVGRDKGNHILFVQRPALLDLKRAEANGLTTDDLLMHYVYVNEYLWQILEAEDPFGEMTSVIDMTGIKMGILRRKDLVAFVKKLVKTMDSHYPQRAHKTLVLNAPKWFNVLFKLLSPLMRESTKKKIEIHSRGRKQDAALKTYLGEKATDVLPASMWSTAEEPSEDTDLVHSTTEQLFQSELEQELRSFVLARNQEFGQEMKSV